MPKLSLKRRDALAMLGAAPLAAPALAAPDDVAALLKRNTQALLDAITNGDAAVWQRLLADEAVVTDESGIVNDKATIVKSIAPLPARISGNIAVQDFAAHVRGDVAVVTYVSDEHESFFGAKLHCQYRSTDSWRRDAGEWRLIASQVLAIRTDPPATVTDLGEQLAGTYALAPDRKMVIAYNAGALTISEAGRPPKPLFAEADTVFFVPGSPRYRYLPEFGLDGQATTIIQRREAWDLRWVREP